MNMQRAAGILVIAGLVFAIAGSVVFPAEYYIAESEAERQSVLDANQSGWVATNWLWLAAGVVTAVGLLLFEQQNRDPLSLARAGLFAEGEKVIARFDIHGTNTGSFAGQRPKGKKVNFESY